MPASFPSVDIVGEGDWWVEGFVLFWGCLLGVPQKANVGKNYWLLGENGIPLTLQFHRNYF